MLRQLKTWCGGRSLAEKETENKELKEKVEALEGWISTADREVEAAKREVPETNEKMSYYTSDGKYCYRDVLLI